MNDEIIKDLISKGTLSKAAKGQRFPSLDGDGLVSVGRGLPKLRCDEVWYNV
jgi:hypothetical protein